MVWENLLDLLNQTKSQPRLRLGKIVAVDPLKLSVEDLPVDANHIIKVMLPRMLQAGDTVVLLPFDEDEQYFVLVGIVEG